MAVSGRNKPRKPMSSRTSKQKAALRKAQVASAKARARNAVKDAITTVSGNRKKPGYYTVREMASYKKFNANRSGPRNGRGGKRSK